MRLAVPEHQGRVAPVFDCCRRMLIFLQNPEQHKLVEDQDWSLVPRMARPKRLQELTIELLICGGISCWMEDQICGQGILIIPWIAGGVEEVLAALRQGRISDPCYTMPGRGKCRRKGRFEIMQELRKQARGPFQRGA